MRRKGKVGAIEGLGRRDVRGRGWGGAEAEEDPGKVVVPVSAGGAGPECIFKAAVETFHKAIRLGVVGGGRAVLNVECSAQAVPEGRGELWATVRGDSGGNAEAGNPVVNKGGGAGVGGGRGEGNCLRPSGSAVNDSEEVSMLG